MESSSSDHDVELGWSCDDGRDDKMMRQLHLQVPGDELCGGNSTQYESAEKLVSGAGNMSQNLIHEIKKQIKDDDDDDMGNWWSFSNGTTCTTANTCLTHHDPPLQAQADEVREMMYRMAAMQPIEIDPDTVKPPKRRNVKISKDPQSVAARHRREKISQRIRILQRLVPGGTKLDTASMLDEAIHYLKFLKSHLNSLQSNPITITSPPPTSSNYLPHPHIQYYHIN